jgi:hypothetical protein
MKQTPAAIIVLAAAIFAAGCAIAYAWRNDNLATWLGVISLVSGVCGTLFLIRACLLDHEMAVDVRGRLDFLEELVYLERIALEHRQRRGEIRGEIPDPPSLSFSSERFSSRRAA